MKAIWFCLFLVISCSHQQQVSSEIKNDNETFSYTDQTGEYAYNRQVLVESKKHKFSSMAKIIDKLKMDKPVIEKTISVSEMGSLKKSKKRKSKNVLRPSLSQHTVWLEGKKYFSQIKIDPKERSLEVTLDSPEEKWTGSKTHPLPQKSGIYCFFTQIPECLHFSGMLFELKNKPNSKLNIGIIFEGYPYMMEQVENIPSGPVTLADVNFEGISDDGAIRYSVDVYGQKIFYHFNKNFELNKILWVAQGISIVK